MWEAAGSARGDAAAGASTTAAGCAVGVANTASVAGIGYVASVVTAAVLTISTHGDAATAVGAGRSMSITQGCVGAKGGFRGSAGTSTASDGSAFAAAAGLTSGTGDEAVSTSAGAGVGSRAGAGLRDVGVAAGATAARAQPQCPQKRAPTRTGAWHLGHNAAGTASDAAAGATADAGSGAVANVPPQLLQCSAPARLTAAQVGQITLIQSP